jgi:hypothetical protein
MPRYPKLAVPNLGKAADALEDQPFDLGVFDVLLPCRQFDIGHKVAVLGRLSMTGEFLLRLLHSVEGLDESEARIFFGFDERELGWVLKEAEEAGHIVRKEGRLWLSLTGRGLFRDGSKEPQIHQVEKRNWTVGFDLFALAPADRAPLSRFEMALPELKIEDVGRVSSAGKLIDPAFRKFFGEIQSRYGSENMKKQSLYSVDDVVPNERFSSIVRIVAKAKARRPGLPEPDLSGWRAGHELDDRSAVIERGASFLETLRSSARPDDGRGYACLLETAPEFLSEFVRRGELSVDRYFRETVRRVGEVRSDRPTIPLAGSLFTEGNVRRLFEALRYATEMRPHRPKAFFWLVPQVQAWGATRILPTMLDQMERVVVMKDEDDDSGPKSIALVAGRPPRHIPEAFDTVISGTVHVGLPPTLEIFLAPGLLTAVLVHAPISGPDTHSVPLGIASFDERVVRRAQERLANCLPHESEISGKLPTTDARTFVESVLIPSPAAPNKGNTPYG